MDPKIYEQVSKGAIFSDDYTKRYALWRIWSKDSDDPKILWIGLNPSTADANQDDATIRRLISFSQKHGYGGFYICNVFSTIETQSENLVEDRDDWIKNLDQIMHFAKMCTAVAFCWGNNSKVSNQMVKTLEQLFPSAKCLKATQHNKPGHPLYLPGDTKLRDWRNKI